jgi:hypothetical protein
MVKKIALVALVAAVLVLAHTIEITARPSTGRQGQHVPGSHEH